MTLIGTMGPKGLTKPTFNCLVVIIMLCAVVSRVDFNQRPSSSTPIHYHSVRCLGEENHLTDCPGISEITSSCTHFLDAHIVCRPQTFTISRKSLSDVLIYHCMLFSVLVVLVVQLPCSSVVSHSHAATI